MSLKFKIKSKTRNLYKLRKNVYYKIYAGTGPEKMNIIYNEEQFKEVFSE